MFWNKKKMKNSIRVGFCSIISQYVKIIIYDFCYYDRYKKYHQPPQSCQNRQLKDYKQRLLNYSSKPLEIVNSGNNTLLLRPTGQLRPCSMSLFLKSFGLYAYLIRMINDKCLFLIAKVSATVRYAIF